MRGPKLASDIVLFILPSINVSQQRFLLLQLLCAQVSSGYKEDENAVSWLESQNTWKDTILISMRSLQR